MIRSNIAIEITLTSQSKYCARRKLPIIKIHNIKSDRPSTFKSHIIMLRASTLRFSNFVKQFPFLSHSLLSSHHTVQSLFSSTTFFYPSLATTQAALFSTQRDLDEVQEENDDYDDYDDHDDYDIDDETDLEMTTRYKANGKGIRKPAVKKLLRDWVDDDDLFYRKQEAKQKDDQRMVARMLAEWEKKQYTGIKFHYPEQYRGTWKQQKVEKLKGKNLASERLNETNHHRVDHFAVICFLLCFVCSVLLEQGCKISRHFVSPAEAVRMIRLSLDCLSFNVVFFY